MHAQIEEELFYPAAREALGAEDEDLLNEAKVERESLKKRIAKIEEYNFGCSSPPAIGQTRTALEPNQ